MSFLFPKPSSLPRIAPSPSGGGQALDEARRARRLATELRGGRAPTILGEPAGAAGRPVTIAGALQDGARRPSTILTESRFAPAAGGGTGSSEEARGTPGLAARLRSGRVPTILTGARLGGSEPAGDADRPAATAGAPGHTQSVPPRRKTTQQRIRETQRGMIQDIFEQEEFKHFSPEARKEIKTLKANPGKVLTIRFEGSRRWAILNNQRVLFNIKDNPQADPTGPSHKEHNKGVTAVRRFDPMIEREARVQGVEPRLVRAIMYVENADASRFGLSKIIEDLGFAKTLFPMNINPTLWAGLIGVTEEEFRKPEVNIRAAVTLIKRIQERLDKNDRTPAKIGSIYNFTGRENVSDVGARIQKAFDKKLWEK